MKDVCVVCHEEKEISEFQADKNRRGGYRRRCKHCHGQYMRGRYADGKWAKQENDPRFLAVRAAKSMPCCDCGNKFPTYVMDLDHLPQYRKLFSLSRWRYHSIKEVKEEILKCEAVCANCHRVRTHIRGYR